MKGREVKQNLLWVLFDDDSGFYFLPFFCFCWNYSAVKENMKLQRHGVVRFRDKYVHNVAPARLWCGSGRMGVRGLKSKLIPPCLLHLPTEVTV